MVQARVTSDAYTRKVHVHVQVHACACTHIHAHVRGERKGVGLLQAQHHPWGMDVVSLVRLIVMAYIVMAVGHGRRFAGLTYSYGLYSYGRGAWTSFRWFDFRFNQLLGDKAGW